MRFSKSIIPIIEAKQTQFTPAERKIADYFLHHIQCNTDDDFSSKAVAAHLNISEASLTRFSQKCGFRGFREFIYAFNAPDEAQSTDFSQPVLSAYQELLQKTYSLVNLKKIHKITQLLLKKKRVFIYGKGSSGIPAQEMKFRFMRIGLTCEAITDDDMMRMNTVLVDKDSLIIGISISGDTNIVIESLYTAKAQKAATVLLTANDNAEFSDNFDVVQLLAIKNNLECGRLISPQFPILIVLDILYADYMHTDKKRRESIWQKTYNALKQNKQ